MHYELYVDSLFFINFVMNLYLLILVNHSTLRTATPGRLMAGAAVGALCFLLLFAKAGPAALRLAVGILSGTLGMLLIAFPVKTLRMFLKLLERLLLYSFGMGGVMLFLVRTLPWFRGALTGIFGILGAGGLGFLLFRRFRWGIKTENCLCRATLIRDDGQVTVTALIDSGNTLVEPVSGKPACVVERNVFSGLWKNDTMGFRAIPYHSVGKRRGIMPGYLLPKLKVEAEGMTLVFDNVYIAVSDEQISGGESAGAESVKMIINPGLFDGKKKGWPRRRQNERNNDTKSGNTGQNAI